MVLSAYYQPNRPHWDVAHIYSVLHSLCSVSPLTLFPDQCSPPPPSPYTTWLSQPVRSFSLLWYLLTSHLFPRVPARLFDFVSLVRSTLLPLSFSLCCIALAASRISPPLPPFPSCWSIFYLLCLHCLFPPHSLPVYLPSLCNPWVLLINGGSPFLPHLFVMTPHSFSSHPISAHPLFPSEKSKAPKGEQVNVLAVWDTLVTFQSGICFYRSWFKKSGAAWGCNREMKRGMERKRGRRRGAHGMVQLPRDCGLCIVHSRGCGPAVADQLINGSMWSCHPQVAGSRTLGTGTDCGSARDKMKACHFLKLLQLWWSKNAACTWQKSSYVLRLERPAE